LNKIQVCNTLTNLFIDRKRKLLKLFWKNIKSNKTNWSDFISGEFQPLVQMWASEEHRRLQASLLQVSHNNLPWLKINESIFQTFWKEEGCAKFLLYQLETKKWPKIVDNF
jgi:hypothetical protein